jgi:hypothetical protein
VDFVRAFPFPERLRPALCAAFAGESSGWPTDISEDEVTALIGHGVAPLAYAAGRVPQLRAEAIRAAALEPLRAADVRSTLEILRRAGVAPLILKGTALAYHAYSAPELRPRGDTDLLIAPEDVEPARTALLAHGFSEQPASGDEEGMRQAMFTRYDGFGIRHAYDVHWDALNVPLFRAAFRFDSLRACAIPLVRLGEDARGLAPEHALLLACVHRVAHHHDSDRLIWLADIALLLRTMTADEHARFWRAARDHGALAICRRSVELAGAWAGALPGADPARWLSAQDLARVEPSRVLLERDLAYGRLLLANLAALPMRARVRRVRQLLFPPADYLRQALGAGPLPVLWLRRARRAFIRMFRKASTL